MRDGGSVLALAVPGWDVGAKVPVRTEAVNDRRQPSKRVA